MAELVASARRLSPAGNHPPLAGSGLPPGPSTPADETGRALAPLQLKGLDMGELVACARRSRAVGWFAGRSSQPSALAGSGSRQDALVASARRLSPAGNHPPLAGSGLPPGPSTPADETGRALAPLQLRRIWNG
jgi:hypothetical protein